MGRAQRSDKAPHSRLACTSEGEEGIGERGQEGKGRGISPPRLFLKVSAYDYRFRLNLPADQG